MTVEGGSERELADATPPYFSVVAFQDPRDQAVGVDMTKRSQRHESGWKACIDHLESFSVSRWTERLYQCCQMGIPNAREVRSPPNAFPVNAAKRSRVVIIILPLYLSWARWLQR